MRYSFHGKMRFTGQVVDGFIEAKSSMEAIDNLADEGIIGVYTVRPEPLASKKKQLQFEGFPQPAMEAPVETAVSPLVAKLTTLIGQVEQMLARPAPSLNRPEQKIARRHFAPTVNEEQNAALRAIFQTNLDLRRDIEQIKANGSGLRPNERKLGRETSPRTLGITAQPAA